MVLVERCDHTEAKLCPDCVEYNNLVCCVNELTERIKELEAECHSRRVAATDSFKDEYTQALKQELSAAECRIEELEDVLQILVTYYATEELPEVRLKLDHAKVLLQKGLVGE